MPKRNMSEGMRFGALVVVMPYIAKNRSKRNMHLCLCDCGTEKMIDGSHLMRGAIVSCGCYRAKITKDRQTKHGGHGTRTYAIWKGMRRRCNNVNDKAYPRYGGAGITICDKWSDYSSFLNDMGACPDGLTIDRINGRKGYCIENCRWASYTQQSRNKNWKNGIPPGVNQRSSGIWTVVIGDNYKQHYIGSSRKLEDAIDMRLAAEDKYWGGNR